MVDTLSRKIREKHNYDLNIKNYCYIGTNETNLLLTIKSLKQETENNLHKCHIGISGWYNFDIIYMRNSNRGIFFDCNSNQITFLKWTLINIKDSYSRNDFINKMEEYINMMNNIYSEEHKIIVKNYGYNDNNWTNAARNKIHETCILFYPNISEDILYSNFTITSNVADEIKYELIREGSWLSTEESYQYIRKLVLADKIAVLCEDIRNKSTFEYIANILYENNVIMDTIYLSNIADYISDYELISFINMFQRDNPHVIWCKSDVSLKQRVTSIPELIIDIKLN
jgi:hypothetical protein